MTITRTPKTAVTTQHEKDLLCKFGDLYTAIDSELSKFDQNQEKLYQAAPNVSPLFQLGSSTPEFFKAFDSQAPDGGSGEPLTSEIGAKLSEACIANSKTSVIEKAAAEEKAKKAKIEEELKEAKAAEDAGDQAMKNGKLKEGHLQYLAGFVHCRKAIVDAEKSQSKALPELYKSCSRALINLKYYWLAIDATKFWLSQRDKVKQNEHGENDKMVGLYYCLMEAYNGLERYESALIIANHAIKIATADPDFYFWRGEIYEKLSQLHPEKKTKYREEAIADYQRILKGACNNNISVYKDQIKLMAGRNLEALVKEMKAEALSLAVVPDSGIVLPNFSFMENPVKTEKTTNEEATPTLPDFPLMDTVNTQASSNTKEQLNFVVRFHQHSSNTQHGATSKQSSPSQTAHSLLGSLDVESPEGEDEDEVSTQSNLTTSPATRLSTTWTIPDHLKFYIHASSDAKMALSSANPCDYFAERAKYAENQGEYGIARILWQLVIQNSPKNPSPYQFLSRINIKEGYDLQAIREADKALKLNPHLSVVYYYRGVAHFNLNQHKEAIIAFNQGSYRQPRDPDYYFMLARTYEESGQLDNALLNYKKILSGECNLELSAEVKLDVPLKAKNKIEELTKLIHGETSQGKEQQPNAKAANTESIFNSTLPLFPPATPSSATVVELTPEEEAITLPAFTSSTVKQE